MPVAISTAPRLPYRLKLHHIECCSCNVNCMCQFGGGPDPGYCEFIIGYQVIDGHVGPVDLKGLKFVVVAKYPKAIHEGHGHVALFVDDKAGPPQVDAIVQVLSGKLGGMPWEALASTVEKFEGPILKPIEMKADGHRSSFRIADVLAVQQTPIKDAVTGEDKEIHVVYPKGGFLWDDGSIGQTAVMNVNYGGLKFSHAGHYAAAAEANWTNER